MEQKHIYLGRNVEKQKQTNKKQANNLLLIRFRARGRSSLLVASKSEYCPWTASIIQRLCCSLTYKSHEIEGEREGGDGEEGGGGREREREERKLEVGSIIMTMLL